MSQLPVATIWYAEPAYQRVTSAPASRLIDAQDGVLTTAQAQVVFTRGHLRAQLAARRWRQPARGVIVMHNGPLTDNQCRWAALLSCRQGAALGGLSALTLDGFEGFELRHDRHHVVLPEGAARPRNQFVLPHWSTMLGSADVHPLKLPRRTRPPRSLVDEAAWSTPPRRARAVILAGVQQGMARPSDLRAALAGRGTCRHRALIKESILDADGGIHSLPERDFDLICRRFSVPPPTRQQALRRPDGRYFLDAGWDEFDAAVEVHGIPHLGVLTWDRDLFRANEIAVRGPRLLAFSSYAVRHEPDAVGSQLVRLLRRQGCSI